jgi:transposase
MCDNDFTRVIGHEDYMGIAIPGSILELRGQVVKGVTWNHEEGTIVIRCNRDRRIKPVDQRGGMHSKNERYLRRTIMDVPVAGKRCLVDIEYLQLYVHGHTQVESLPFVSRGQRITKRMARLVSALCRHMTISAVAKYTGLSWDTVKSSDKACLAEQLPPLRPDLLEGLRLIGVDEVARAKGHDYLTLVYDMVTGDLLWIKEGRTADVFGEFLQALSTECADGIEAVAMDMGLAYQSAVRRWLPEAKIVFDRFHVMQLYSKVIKQVRRAEFSKADAEHKIQIKGTAYLLLSNRDKLKEDGEARLQTLLETNQTLHTVYMLKEQLQALWQNPPSVETMHARLEDWCQLAEAAKITPLKTFAKTLRSHADGICNYAAHPITSAAIEAGNVGIGLIRKRARGILDTDYLKLKIRQLNTPDTAEPFYPIRRRAKTRGNAKNIAKNEKTTV